MVFVCNVQNRCRRSGKWFSILVAALGAAMGMPCAAQAAFFQVQDVTEAVAVTEVSQDAKRDRVFVRNIAAFPLASIATRGQSGWVLVQVLAWEVPTNPSRAVLDKKTNRVKVIEFNAPQPSVEGTIKVIAPLTGSLGNTIEGFTVLRPMMVNGSIASKERLYTSPFLQGGTAIMQIRAENIGMSRYQEVNRISEDWCRFVVPAAAFFRANEMSLKIRRKLGNETQTDLRVLSRLWKLTADKNLFIAVYACRTLLTNNMLTPTLMRQMLSQEEPLRQAVFVNILLSYTPDTGKKEMYESMRRLIRQTGSPLQIVGFALGLSTIRTPDDAHLETLNQVFLRSQEPSMTAKHTKYLQAYIDELKATSEPFAPGRDFSAK